MDVFLNWTVNLSPIIVIIFYLIFWKLISNDSDWVAMAIFLIFGLFSGIFPHIMCAGYGNIVIAVVTQSALTILWILLVIAIIIGESLLNKLIYIFIYGTYIIISILLIYERLEMENILKIEFLDYIIDKFWNTNYFKLLVKIIENEWFKGIAIASIGGIISGLVLKKLNKKGR